jgi:hypothetical protein
MQSEAVELRRRSAYPLRCGSGRNGRCHISLNVDPEDRREVNPPIEVESATWSASGTLDCGTSLISEDFASGERLSKRTR